MKSSGVRPPAGWSRLLALVLHPEDREGALGDLQEEMAERAARDGVQEARRWYRRQVVRSVWPALARRWRAGIDHGTGEGGTMGITAGIQDLHFALRTLARHRAFAATVLLTLGLGIGAATAVFTVVEGVLVRPLPYPEPDRLRMVYQERDGSSFWVSAPNFRDWQEGIEGFEHLAAFSPDGANMVVEGSPVRIASAEVSAEFFRTLGVAPVLGRSFTAEEMVRTARVAVISHRTWQDRFGASPDVVGRTLTLDGEPHDVVGVLPPVRMLPADTDVWIPLRTDSPDWRTRRGIGWLLVVGRVAPGVGDEVLDSELTAVGTALREAHPDANRDMGIQALSLEETVVGDVRRPLRVLMTAVLLILVVVCTNVGGLLVARAVARRREVAVRAALGGGRGRLLSQFLTEGLLLAGLGGLLGLAFAWLGVSALLAIAPPDVPRLDEVRVGAGSFAFAGSVSLVSALLFSALPALHVFQDGFLNGLREGAGTAGRGSARLRRGLVTVQLAVALALVAGSALLLVSFHQLRDVDPGFEPRGVLTAGLPLVESSFASPEERLSHLQSVVEAAAAIPGVAAAALTNAVPFVNSGPTFSYELRDPPADPDERLLARYRVVTPGLFEALGMRFVAGRGFTPAEAAPDGPRAMVVDEPFARDHFPGGEALGQEVRLLDEWWTIVGVVAAVRDGDLRGLPERHMYLPLARASRQGTILVVRTEGEPDALTEPLRRAVRALDPGQPLPRMGPLEDRIADSVARPRFLSWLVSSFAAASLLLATLGIYGVMAYTVARQTREIGVRMALGAGRASVRRLVVRQAAGMIVAGTALGLILTALAAPHLGELLYQVEPRDPLLLSTVALVLASAALAGVWLPVTRAARLNPSRALRID